MIRRGDEIAPQFGAGRQSIGDGVIDIGGEMFAGMTQTCLGAHQRQQTIEMFARESAAHAHIRRRSAGAGFKRMGDVADQPGAALCGAANHHRIGAGRAQHVSRIVCRSAIAIGDDRNAHGGGDGGDRRPISAALVKLLTGAAMHGEQRDAFSLGATRQFGRVTAGVIPAQTHFHGDGNRNGGARRRNQPHRLIEIAHQRRASESAGDAFAGAAHVDVDPIGAGLLGAARGGGDAFHITRRNLHDARSRRPCPGGAGAQTQRCLTIAALNAGAGDHFADGRAGPMSLGDPAHGEIGDARHRRKKGPTGKARRADLDRRRLRAD